MSTHYESAFDDLRLQIQQFSPNAVPVLDQLNDDCGAKTAYHAAFILICLKAQQELPHSPTLNTMTSNDLKDYTFFEIAQDHQMAINLFDQALVAYCTDQANDAQ